jgi:hypothetical protein
MLLLTSRGIGRAIAMSSQLWCTCSSGCRRPVSWVPCQSHFLGQMLGSSRRPVSSFGLSMSSPCLVAHHLWAQWWRVLRHARATLFLLHGPGLGAFNLLLLVAVLLEPRASHCCCCSNAAAVVFYPSVAWGELLLVDALTCCICQGW